MMSNFLNLSHLCLLPLLVCSAVGWTAPVAKPNLEKHALLMVDGFMGDFTKPSYENLRQDWQVKSKSNSTKIVRPSTLRSIDQNAQYLKSVIGEFRSELRSDQRLIVMAHSRGAVEAALAFMQNPSMFSEYNVAQVVLVQGALGGSPFAEMALQKFESWCGKFFEASALIFENPFDRKGWCEATKPYLASVESLVPANTQALIASAKQGMRHVDVENFHSKVSYVRSEQVVSELPFNLKPSGMFLSRYYGPSDGVTITKDQKLEQLGLDLGVWRAHHMELVANDQNKDRQRVFMHWLTKTLKVHSRL